MVSMQATKIFPASVAGRVFAETIAATPQINSKLSAQTCISNTGEEGTRPSSFNAI